MEKNVSTGEPVSVVPALRPVSDCRATDRIRLSQTRPGRAGSRECAYRDLQAKRGQSSGAGVRRIGRRPNPPLSKAHFDFRSPPECVIFSDGNLTVKCARTLQPRYARAGGRHAHRLSSPASLQLPPLFYLPLLSQVVSFFRRFVPRFPFTTLHSM